MTIEKRAVGEVVVLELGGAFTAGEEARFRDKVHSLVFEGCRGLVINMERLTRMDSTGLGAIVSAYTTVTNAGGRVALANLTKRISDLMAITKLLTVFSVHDSEAQAIAEVTERPASVPA